VTCKKQMLLAIFATQQKILPPDGGNSVGNEHCFASHPITWYTHWHHWCHQWWLFYFCLCWRTNMYIFYFTRIFSHKEFFLSCTVVSYKTFHWQYVFFILEECFPHMEFFLSHSAMSYRTYCGFIGVHVPVGQAPFHTPWYGCLAKKSPDKNPL